MSYLRSRTSPRTPCNLATRKPCDTIVEEILSVLTTILHILLYIPGLLYQAIRFLTIILRILLFFAELLYQAIRFLTIILHILLLFADTLYQAIKSPSDFFADLLHQATRFLTIILHILLFFADLLYQAIKSRLEILYQAIKPPSNFPFIYPFAKPIPNVAEHTKSPETSSSPNDKIKKSQTNTTTTPSPVTCITTSLQPPNKSDDIDNSAYWKKKCGWFVYPFAKPVPNVANIKEHTKGPEVSYTPNNKTRKSQTNTTTTPSPVTCITTSLQPSNESETQPIRKRNVAGSQIKSQVVSSDHKEAGM